VLPAQERITSEHIVTIAEKGNRIGFVTDIPGAVTVANEYGTLVFRPAVPARRPVDDTWKLALDEGASHGLPDGRMITLQRVEPQHFARDPVGFAQTYATVSQVFIDGETLGCADGELEVSYLHPGDRLCPLGMNGQHKLVSDVLVDRKIPKHKRSDLLKVFVQNDRKDEIVWIIDVCLDDRYKVSTETTSMFSIIVSGTESV
jgi:tRNA(Ile)-lysidine synthetase-like protein